MGLVGKSPVGIRGNRTESRGAFLYYSKRIVDLYRDLGVKMSGHPWVVRHLELAIN